MDALSALKMFPTAQAGASPMSSIQDAVSAGVKTIPAQELQQVNSDNPLQNLAPTPGIGGDGSAFENMLGGLVNDVTQKEAAANNSISGLLSGQNVSLHQAMISMEEANVSFQMMVEVRNRLLDSYQELMRMQI